MMHFKKKIKWKGGEKTSFSSNWFKNRWDIILNTVIDIVILKTDLLRIYWEFGLLKFIFYKFFCLQTNCLPSMFAINKFTDLEICSRKFLRLTKIKLMKIITESFIELSRIIFSYNILLCVIEVPNLGTVIKAVRLTIWLPFGRQRYMNGRAAREIHRDNCTDELNNFFYLISVAICLIHE